MIFIEYYGVQLLLEALMIIKLGKMVPFQIS